MEWDDGRAPRSGNANVHSRKVLLEIPDRRSTWFCPKKIKIRVIPDNMSALEGERGHGRADVVREAA